MRIETVYFVDSDDSDNRKQAHIAPCFRFNGVADWTCQASARGQRIADYGDVWNLCRHVHQRCRLEKGIPEAEVPSVATQKSALPMRSF